VSFKGVEDVRFPGVYSAKVRRVHGYVQIMFEYLRLRIKEDEMKTKHDTNNSNMM